MALCNYDNLLRASCPNPVASEVKAQRICGEVIQLLAVHEYFFPATMKIFLSACSSLAVLRNKLDSNSVESLWKLHTWDVNIPGPWDGCE